jgi:hypothetical protein
VFCSWDFFLLHDNVPIHKAASVCQFLTPKNVTTLYPPVPSRFISARLFSVPQVENKVKATPLCGCCWDPRSRNWLIKEGPKRGIFGSFQKLYDRAKACIYGNEDYFGQKRVYVFLMCLRFLKKPVLKLSDRTVYYCSFCSTFDLL